MKKISILTLFSALMFFTSCEKYLDVNTDPNNPQIVPIETIFPTAVASTAMVSGGFFVTIGSLWSQQFTQNNNSSQYRTIDSYNVTPSTTPFNQIYTESFTNGLKNLNHIIKEAEEANNWSVHLAATALFCYVVQNLVDVFDKIPYSEALQGTGNFSPKFDNGQDIYPDLIVRLNNALDKDFTLLTNTNLGDNDFIFGGSVEGWQKFVNTLKLRLYLRQSKANPSVANAGMLACLSSPIGFVTDAKMTVFTTAAGAMNPFFQTNISTNGLGIHNHRASNTMVNFLVDHGDPRLRFFYITGTNVATAIVGLDQGNFADVTTVGGGAASNGRWAATDPVYFFSAPQVLFMIAEAKELTGGDGKADYEAGVRAAFALAGTGFTTPFVLTAADAETFIASGGPYEYPATTTADKIEAIITQKWVAATMRTPIEAWLDHNRTGYPAFFTPSIASVLVPNTLLPKRFLFPQNEYNTNPNVPAQVPISTPVWWAQ
ncbi:MAG: SusD/RagB family nutrient-binding outer membrane lipoprotein [Bacteroidales bacterium]|nr:SusD/RagB family nutrient-binding outer membrane lipoprotein [Bacteroidales bacterium]